MTETGKIREIIGKTVIVTPDLSDACFGCMKEECKACGGIYADGIYAANPLSLPLKAGLTVEVSAPGLSVFRQALAALIPPAVGFTAGFFLVRLFFTDASEAACAAVGVVLLFVAAFIIYAIRKRKPPEKAFTVTRILDN
jgi:positive regulator of sigma E activity